jgi:hypothetical protein
MLPSNQADLPPSSKKFQKLIIGFSAVIVLVAAATTVGVILSNRTTNTTATAVSPMAPLDTSTSSRELLDGDIVNITYAEDLKAAKIFVTSDEFSGGSEPERYIVVFYDNATREEMDDAADILFGSARNDFRRAVPASVGVDSRGNIGSRMGVRTRVGRNALLSEVIEFVEPDRMYAKLFRV